MKQNSHPSKIFMLAAIAQAQEAKARGDFALGSVIIKNHHIVSQAGDSSKTKLDPLSHAPILAIRLALAELKTDNLSDCVIYATQEFCPMCATAIVLAKMGGAVFGASLDQMREYGQQTSFNYIGQVLNVTATSIIEKSPYQIFLIPGFMEEECRSLLA